MSIESEAFEWLQARRKSTAPEAVTAGWEDLTVQQRGARVEWLRLFRWQAAGEIADWVAESGVLSAPPIDSPPAEVRQALDEYLTLGEDLEAVVDWAMAYRG